MHQPHQGSPNQCQQSTNRVQCENEGQAFGKLFLCFCLHHNQLMVRGQLVYSLCSKRWWPLGDTNL